MFDLGIQELVVIFVVALMVFGPKRLPELARTMGKTMGQLKKAMLNIKTEVDKEMEDLNPLPRMDELAAFKNLPKDMMDKVLNPDSNKTENKTENKTTDDTTDKPADKPEPVSADDTASADAEAPAQKQENPAISDEGEPVMYADEDLADSPAPEKGDES
jgi:Tat protein translocase TatB subunit